MLKFSFGGIKKLKSIGNNKKYIDKTMATRLFLTCIHVGVSLLWDKVEEAHQLNSDTVITSGRNEAHCCSFICMPLLPSPGTISPPPLPPPLPYPVCGNDQQMNKRVKRKCEYFANSLPLSNQRQLNLNFLQQKLFF